MNNLIALYKLRTFDKSFSLDVCIQRPDRYRHIDSLSNLEPIIARGGGFSYSPASFGHGSKSIDMNKFNRIGVFDHANSTIHLESGVKLIELINWAAKRKLHLPVLPGHPHIAIGGCIAADVHEESRFFIDKDTDFYLISVDDLNMIHDCAVDVCFSSNFFEHLPSKDAINNVLLGANRALKIGGNILQCNQI